MAEDVRVNEESSHNPCCQLWIDKYTKLKERHSKLEDARNALRKGLTIFEQQIAKIESENLSLKKACEYERARAESEKEDKLKESARRVTLENEVSTLKSEILLLQQNGDLATQVVDEDVGNLQRRVSEAELEINLLKELVEEEKKRVDAEKEKVEMERKKAQDAMKKVKAENKKASEEKRLANIERKKAEELRLQLESLKCEADEAKSKLALETARYEQENKQLKAERESTSKDKKRADIEMAKAAEQRKLAEENWRKAMDEKNRADELSQKLDQNKQRLVELENQIHKLESTTRLVENSAEQPTRGHEELAGDICSVTMKNENGSLETRKRLEEMELKIIREKKQAKSVRKKAEEQRKVAETYKTKAIEEKHRADLLSCELELKKQRLEGVQKEIQELVFSGKVSSHPASGGSLKAKIAEIKMLRKQLKFEKARVKHAKEVAKLEVGRNCILKHEVHRLRQEIIQISQHLGRLDDSLFHNYEDINKLDKKGSLNLGQGHIHLKPSELILHNENELVNQPSCTTSAAIGGTAALKENQRCAILLPPISGEIHRSPTGTDSNLELLLRGSNTKMLQSYAINSSSASFSDRPLVGSQDRGTFSVTTSTKLAAEQNLEPTASRLSGDTRKTNDEMLAAGAENSVGSPIKSCATERNGSHRKKKRPPDTVESIEHLCSVGQKQPMQVLQKQPMQVLQKLSMAHGTLDCESSKSLDEDRLLCNKPVRPHKKKKASAGHSMAIHNLYDTSEPKTQTRILGAEGCDVFKNTATECNVLQTSLVLNDGTDNILASKFPLPRNSEEVFSDDFMKLVDLDNATDENRFRKAIEKPISPLSPMLCNIKFSSSEMSKLEMVTSTSLPDESLFVNFSKVEENVLPSGSYDVVKMEIDSNESTLKNLGASYTSIGTTEPANDNCENLGNNGGDSSDFISGRMQNISIPHAASRNEDLKIPFKRIDSLNCSLKYCAILSNHSDSSTIPKIFHVSSDCMTHCSGDSSLKSFIQNILLSLQKADDLSAEGRVSVFFSLLLHYISEITNGDLGNYSDSNSLQFIDSFGQQMRAVLNDVDIGGVFVELCDMYELVSLIEDLLLNRRILTYDVSHGDSRSKDVIDSNCTFWSIQAASTDLLLAAGLILGSICAAVDQIGFVCEVSCNIFSIKTINSSLLLRLLHFFAYLCGAKFFTLEGYGLVMSVLKCLVVFLERQNSSRDCFSCMTTVVGPCMKISAYSACPFSDGAVSVDVMLSVLLEKLQNYALSGKQHLMDALHSSHCSSIDDVQYPGEGVPPNFVSNQYLCYFIDILSLVELLASFMSWDWIFGNIVSRLLQMLDACVQENVFLAIFALLGQLGRLGVYAKGFEDLGVENVRKRLCAFLGKSMFRNFGLPVQFACVCALVGLISRPLEEIVETNFAIPTAGSQSVAMDCIRKWFSSLRKEQQSSFKSLQSSIKRVSIRGNHAFNDAL